MVGISGGDFLVLTVWDPTGWLGLVDGDESSRSARGRNSGVVRLDWIVRSGAGLKRGDGVAGWLNSNGDGGLGGHGHGCWCTRAGSGSVSWSDVAAVGRWRTRCGRGDGRHCDVLVDSAGGVSCSCKS